MEAKHRSTAKEDDAMTRLKRALNVPGHMPSIQQTQGGPSGSGHTQADHLYLLRYLRNKNLDVEETIKKLERRREFEKGLPAISISHETVAALRSKAFAILPRDMFGRPVLYIRMGLYRLSDSTADQNLAIMILEFLQFLCWQSNATECVILINEEETGWFRTVNAMQDSLQSTLQKYYPEMLGSLLIVNASWVVTQGVKTAVVNRNSKIKNRTHFVKTRDLPRHLGESKSIPLELGGGNNVGATATDFSEHCLRYWYNMTSLIQQELELPHGGILRTVWHPIPSLVPSATSGSSALMDSRSAAVMAVGGSTSALRGISSGAPATRHGTKAQSTHLSAGNAASGRHRSNSVTSHSDNMTDDLCSVISEGDLDQFTWNHGVGISAAGGDSAETGGEGEEPSAFGEVSEEGDVAALKKQLSEETKRRKELEHQVQAMELGTPLDGQTLSRLETSLKQTHEEVNVLVGNVIVESKRKHRGEPSLVTLLEMTNRSLLQVINDEPTVGAMRFSQPVDRKPPSKCSIM